MIMSVHHAEEHLTILVRINPALCVVLNLNEHKKQIGNYLVEELENGSLEISTATHQFIFPRDCKMKLYEFLNEGYEGKINA